MCPIFKSITKKVFQLIIVFFCFSVKAQEKLIINGSVNVGKYSYYQLSFFHPAKKNFTDSYYAFRIGIQTSKVDAFNFRYSKLKLYKESDLTIEQTYYKDQPPLPVIRIYTQVDSIGGDIFSVDYCRLLYESEIIKVDVGFGPLINIMKTKTGVNTTTYYAYGIMTAFGLKVQKKEYPFAFYTNFETHHSFHHRKSLFDYYGGFLFSVGIGINV